jgi:hypothetical protein
MQTNFRIAVGVVSIIVALFLAWRVGLWLEPEKQTSIPATGLPTAAGQGALFLSGEVRQGLTFELRDVRVAEGGKSAEGMGVVRFDVRREDLKPLSVAMLGALKQKLPAAERVKLAVKPYAGAPCVIGEIEWSGGSTRLSYGIPTQQQIDASNALIGTKEGDDRPRLYVPDGETFASGLSVTLAIEAARAKNPGSSEELLLEKGPVAAGVPYGTAKRSRDFMRWYYTGNRYGSEEFRFPAK